MSDFSSQLNNFLSLYESAGYNPQKALDYSEDVLKDNSPELRTLGALLTQTVQAQNPRLTIPRAKQQAFLSNAIDLANGASLSVTSPALIDEIGKIDANLGDNLGGDTSAPFIRPDGYNLPGAGGLQRFPVTGISGDARLNYAFQRPQSQNAQEQGRREALTSLKMADVLKINEDNRPLPTALRQSRSLYHGGVSSGFQDPITNPFSKFVYKAKADKYYVQPTESLNSFRRQKARQYMINLATKEKLLYPLAENQLSLKNVKSGNLPEEANEFARAFRPSNLMIQSGEQGMKAAHKRYYKLPRKMRVFAKRPKRFIFGKKFENRVMNYMSSNESFKIQDIKEGEALKPFRVDHHIQ